ncbi:MAG: trypsin-like peptidase domain-containing protein [Gemmatimonadetes bacterium]|nr:trypsin-like peptidase domain-containing protein [Gemmatimonadota bacterium]
MVQAADRIRVTLLDKRSYDARVVGRDPTTDVAVLKIAAHGLPSVRFGDSEQSRGCRALAQAGASIRAG